MHDDTAIRELLVRDLGVRFGGHYEIEGHVDASAASTALGQHAEQGRSVAAVLVGDTAACGGGGFRAGIREIHPHARRVLIVRRGEWKNEHPAVEAMRTGQADAYVFVPWGLPERWLYLPMTELLADWEASQRPPTEVVQIVGEERERPEHLLVGILVERSYLMRDL